MWKYRYTIGHYKDSKDWRIGIYENNNDNTNYINDEVDNGKMKLMVMMIIMGIFTKFDMNINSDGNLIMKMPVSYMIYSSYCWNYYLIVGVCCTVADILNAQVDIKHRCAPQPVV